MGQTFAVRGGHGLGDLGDHLVGVVHLQRPGGQQSRQLGRVRQPFVDDIDKVVLLDGVEDLDEAGVTEEGGGAGGGQHRPSPGVVRRQDVHADGTAQLLVDRAPTAESVQTGDALLEAVASGEFVTAVQLGRRGRVRVLGPAASLCLFAVRFPLPLLGHPVGRGLVRLGGQRLVAAVVCHVDGRHAPFRHRRPCLPIRCALSDAETNCAHSPSQCTTRGGGRWLCGYPGLSAPGARGPCRPSS